MPFGLGLWEIVILAGVLVLLFGAKGAPAMARRLGTGVREVKDAVTGIDPRGILDPKDEPEAQKPPPRELAAPPVAPAAVQPPAETASAQDAPPAAPPPAQAEGEQPRA